MLFQQFVRQDIGCAAYLVGSTGSGQAAVIDPRIDMVDEIIDLAEREGLTITYIIETHNHADHVSGHHQLAERTGATIAVYHAAQVDYPHLPLDDGEDVMIGDVRLRVIHTPGHRPEHIAIAVIDESRADEPWLVLTGDSLFIGDVARPDLAIDGQEGGALLFDSLHERLLALPDGTLAYPGHVSGSLCGRVTNRMTGTSIGFERRHNVALSIASKDRFVRYMTESLPQRPPNMARIVELNRQAEPLLVGTAQALSATEAQRLLEAGALVLDTRAPGDFAAGHVPGAISVDLQGGQFQNRVGLVVSADASLILVTAHDQDAQRAANALAVIGLTSIAGYIAGGMGHWAEHGLPVATTVEISPRELHTRQANGQPLQVVDVREANEWQSGHIEGAVNVPFYQVASALAEIDPLRPVALVCAGGTRSMIAASVLERAGRSNVVNVSGGMDAWNAAGLPETQTARTAVAVS